MSRPRYLADHDLTESIILGVMRREPTIEFYRVREIGMASRPDTEILEYASREGLILISHDVNTIVAHASERVGAGLIMPGVFVAHQSDPISMTIDDLILIWSASEAEEWTDRVVFLPIR